MVYYGNNMDDINMGEIFMHVNINGLLIERRKSLSWLSKSIDCSYSNLWRLSQNETTSINFDLLEKLCIALECTPNNILIIVEDRSGE